MMISLLLSLTQVPNIHIQILPTDSLPYFSLENKLRDFAK